MSSGGCRRAMAAWYDFKDELLQTPAFSERI
jgi:hypothetical protein